MALSKDYEIEGTGFTVPNAYFVIKEVRVEKRLQDFPYPGMDLTDEERVARGEPLVNFKAGRVAWPTLSVYASKEARDNGMKPVGEIGLSSNLLKSFRCFVEDSDISQQIYTHLKTTEYFEGVVDA